jgi:hypothetical protein
MGQYISPSAKYRKHRMIIQISASIVVSISSCHAVDPGLIPGGGIHIFFRLIIL